MILLFFVAVFKREISGLERGRKFNQTRVTGRDRN